MLTRHYRRTFSPSQIKPPILAGIYGFRRASHWGVARPPIRCLLFQSEHKPGPQPRRLPVTSHPSWPCPTARACGLPPLQQRSSRLHPSSSGAHRVSSAALIAFASARAPAAPAARHQPPVLAVPYGAGLWPAGCRQSWPAAGRPQDRLGGCWWPPQPRGCIPDGTVAK